MVGNVGIFLLIVGFAGFLISGELFITEKTSVDKKIIDFLESKYVVGSRLHEEEGLPTINLREFLTLLPALFLFVTFVGVVLITLTVFIYG